MTAEIGRLACTLTEFGYKVSEEDHSVSLMDNLSV